MRHVDVLSYLGSSLNGAIYFDEANLVGNQNLFQGDAAPVASSEFRKSVILAADRRIVNQVLNGLLRQGRVALSWRVWNAALAE